MTRERTGTLQALAVVCCTLVAVSAGAGVLLGPPGALSAALPTGLPSPSPAATAGPSLGPAAAVTPGPESSSTATASPIVRPSPIASVAPKQTPAPSVALSYPAGPLARLVFEGSRAKKVIAITIDDGASPSVALAELAVLQAAHVNATWFPIGADVVASPSTWRTIAAAGFPIANHTYDHVDLTTRDYATVLADIVKDATIVGRIIGEPLVPFLRPPGGAQDTLVLRAANAAGERAVVIWDTTLGDTGRGPVSQLVSNGERAIAGSIVLMHANDPRSPEALAALITHYRSLGFGFVTLGQLLGVPGPAPYPVFAAMASPSPSAAPPAQPLPAATPMPSASPTPSASPMPSASPLATG